MLVKRKILAAVLCLALVFSSLGLTSTEATYADSGTKELDKIVKQLGDGKNTQKLKIDGETAFDYLSYVYLGWRTTGGKWQNKVIDDFIVEQLTGAGFEWGDASQVPNGDNTQKAPTDKSSTNDGKDYSWVSYYNSTSNVWDPEYSKFEITKAPAGSADLINRINVESYAYDPTSDTYLDYYKGEIGNNIKDDRDMWDWITKKSGGKRVNVENGKEAELNKRTHLAWQTSFTDPKGTTPSAATGSSGKVVYIGSVKSGNETTSEFTSYRDAIKACEGNILLSDSTLRTTTAFAQNVGAVAVMSSNSLNEYNLPKDTNNNIVEPFQKSARYASGAGTATAKAQMDKGEPIVEWQLSYDQKAALKELLDKAKKAKTDVTAKNISIGDIYKMNDASKGAKGQAVAMAEIKGKSKPEERILICAHVQEPGSNDNATGVGAQLELATKLKKMIDEGVIERPERTITFLWGDEMSLATLWLGNHQEEKTKLLASLDMDMVGEDTEKTGGVMRIEKTPDPSAEYNYTLDKLPWQTKGYYDDTYKDSDGNFVRLPDSHTLWGAGSTDGLFKEGFYLNDLYMAASQSVINNHDSRFEVEVCPYEGGSDHSRFLAQNIPSLLTWHFTDYTYHSSVDTLAMSSAKEMENVNITTISTALLMANATGDSTDGYNAGKEVLNIVSKAAHERFETEQKNTDNRVTYMEGNNVPYDKYSEQLDQETEVLNAWGAWYKEAILSVSQSLLNGKKGGGFRLAELDAREALDTKLNESIEYAKTKLAVRNLAAADISAIADLEYTGSPLQPEPTVKIMDKTLTINKDYTVSYKNNLTPGTATLIITGKNPYKGTREVTFNITAKPEEKPQINKPQKTSISKLKSKKKKVTATWKAVPEITKYEIRYKRSTSKKWTTKTVDATKTKITISKLKKGKKYNFQVRSYKTVDGVNIYSEWSKTKSVKVKK